MLNTSRPHDYYLNDIVSGLDSDRYTRCRPCEFDLSDLQGKKEIAATTTNSDGGPHMRL